MTEYKVAWHQVTLPTGQIHAISRQQFTRSFDRGELVDTAEYDSAEWGGKIDRLVEAGALVDLDAKLPEAAPYTSPLDVPLTHSGEESVRVEVDRENDDLDEDDEDDTDETAEEQPVVSLERPSRSASADVWRAYAKAAEVQMDDLDTAKRDEIVAAADQQGK